MVTPLHTASRRLCQMPVQYAAMLAVASNLVRDRKALRILRDQLRGSVVNLQLRAYFPLL
jgi:hypothetical protein